MAHTFKTWSETSPTAKDVLAPTFELRGWDELAVIDKVKILKHLGALGWIITTRDIKTIVQSVDRLNNNYKVQTYGKKLFDIGGAHSDIYGDYSKDIQDAAVDDFVRIMKEESTDVTIELLSFYAEALIDENHLKDNPTDEEIDDAHERFDRFSNAVNGIFGQFGINLSLTRQGFVPKQEQIVHELVIEPTFKGLAAPKWKAVQSNFSKAIKEYRKGTETAYSNSITYIVTAVQAFLQVKVRGKVGKGDISELIKEGMKNNILPKDALSRKVLDGLESTLMEYRQKQGVAHPKTENANEESVRLLLNVAAVFIQHCNS
jgi:hypothetical protein